MIRKHLSRNVKSLSLCALLLGGPYIGLSQDKPTFKQELFDMSLNDLTKVTITSVAKKEQRLFDAASAIHVLTNEEIQRSGVTSIPEALRLIPGVQVGRSGSSTWAISIRGFRDIFANKLLVLIDGRSVYTPVFSGVYWDVQDVVLEDIDRIEVIRGPGASVWGANAVNGVINIITRAAVETQGTLVAVGGGNEDHLITTVRNGFSLGDIGAGKIYAKATARDGLTLRNEERQGYDAWQQYRGGFRTDITLGNQSTLTVQGDVYVGRHDEEQNLVNSSFSGLSPNRGTQDIYGTNLLTRWEKETGNGSKSIVQFYYDRISRDAVDIAQSRDTIDLEFQHQLKINSDLEMLLGGGYRFFDVGTDVTSASVSFDAPEHFDLWSTFIQFEQKLFGDAASILLGTKLSDNDYSGFEFQPTARLRYSLGENTTLWGAVSRAVRTPSNIDQFVRINFRATPGDQNGPPTLFSLFGNENFDSETLQAYEIGFRHLFVPEFNISTALYWNEYGSLSTLESGNPFFEPGSGAPRLVIPATFANKGKGVILGGEISLGYEPFEWWRIQGSYSYSKIDLALDEDSNDRFLTEEERESPEHQAVLRNLISLSEGLTFDPTLRYVDHIGVGDINSYLELDVNLTMKLSSQFSLSIVGTNLLSPSHSELIPTGRANPPARVERAVFVKAMLNL